MNSRELKAQRVRCNLTQKEVAEKAGMTEPDYCNKENGKKPFLLPEVIAIIPVIKIERDIGKINAIFFDGGLPNGKDG